MLTEFGKCLRCLRINNGQLLKEMAETLKVTPAYLSAIENGKRNPTNEIITKLFNAYDLDNEQREEISDSFAKTLKEITIDMSSSSDIQCNLGLVFARKIDSLTEDQISEIKKILDSD